MQETITRMGTNGRLVIPAPLREALGLTAGDEVVLRVTDGELRLLSRAAAIERFQDLVRARVPADRLLSEELIAERRAEAARE